MPKGADNLHSTAGASACWVPPPATSTTLAAGAGAGTSVTPRVRRAGNAARMTDLTLLQHLDLDVLVPDVLAVVLKADMAFAGEVLDRLVVLVLAAVEVLARLGVLVEVGVDDLLAV